MPALMRSALGVCLLLFLLERPYLTGAVVAPVSSAEELLGAFADASTAVAGTDTVVQLQGNGIYLTQASLANYSLPFIIPANTTLELHGAGDQLRSLDFGELPQLLYFRPNTTLIVSHINASGSADPHLGSWPDPGASPTVIQSLPFWPTVGADPGLTVYVRNSDITLHPTEVCTPEIGVAQYAALEQLARAAGTNRSEIDFSGTVAKLVNWSAPLPVLSPTTKIAVGSILVVAENVTIYCSLPASSTAAPAPAPTPLLAPAPASVPAPGAGGNSSSGGGGGPVVPSTSSNSTSSSSSGGGGAPVWVWPLVGVAVALEGIVVLAFIIGRHRRKRKQRLRGSQSQQQPLAPRGSDEQQPGPGQGASPSDPASQPSEPNPHCPSECALSGSLPSAGNSGFLELNGGKTVLPEGYWKSRVGFIEGLQLGGLIGRGGYARVYKGRWKGTMVAVKVVETRLGPEQSYDLRDEPLLCLSLSHPNVLQGYRMCVVRVLISPGDDDAPYDSAFLGCDALLGSGSPVHSGGSEARQLSGGRHLSGSGSSGRLVPHLTDPSCMVEVMPPDAVLEPGMYEMWLVSELADRGTLYDAMKGGWFSTPGDPLGRNMPAILLCMLDVARGLEYLHSCNIVHGDLKPQNVLLKTSTADSRGFVCKLGDFGLSRILQEAESHVDTGSCGTVTHAAPELLTQGRLTKASDVWAYGVLLWELVSGQRLFADMHQMQIIIQVTQKGYRPHIPEGFPAPLADLVQRCWAEDAHDRPTAGDLVQALFEASDSTDSPLAAQSSSAPLRAVVVAGASDTGTASELAP